MISSKRPSFFAILVSLLLAYSHRKYTHTATATIHHPAPDKHLV